VEGEGVYISNRHHLSYLYIGIINPVILMLRVKWIHTTGSVHIIHGGDWQLLATTWKSGAEGNINMVAVEIHLNRLSNCHLLNGSLGSLGSLPVE
jgi:hypothetical protein